jgi:hypothetical protein
VVVPPVSQQIQPITVIDRPKHHKVTAPEISMNIYNYHPRSNFEKKRILYSILALCSLLFALCSLLFALCSLLFALSAV